jgi:hypothetical protein
MFRFAHLTTKQQPGVFYHVTRPPWQPGQPLLRWNRLVAAGIRSATDWRHQTPVGWDGDRIVFHDTLVNARYWKKANRLDQNGIILRVRVPDANQVDLQPNSEQWACYPDEVPASWLDIVGDDEPNYPPFHHSPISS